MKSLRTCRRAGMDGRDHGFRPARSLPFLLLLLTLLPITAHSADPLHVAILPTSKIEGRFAVEPASLDSIFQAKAVENREVILVAPEKVISLLAERGEPCTGFACQLWAGETLGADHMFVVSAVTLGRALRIELRSVNVKEKRVEHAQRWNYTGSLDGFEEDFAGQVEDFLKAVTARKVYLAIRTDPVGASIELNGIPQGISPLLLEVDPSNPVKLAAQLGVMRTEGEVTSFHKDTLSVLMVLQKPVRRHFGMFGGTQGRFYFIGGVTMVNKAVRYDQPAFVSVMAEYGTQWRLGVGVFRDQYVIPGVSKTDLEENLVLAEPMGEALGGFVTLTLSPPIKSFSPLLGVGVTGLQRAVKYEFNEGTATQEEFSLGGLVRFGFEVKLPWNLRAGILFNDIFLLGNSATSNAIFGQPRDIWDQAFDEFDSVTSLNLMLGIAF